MKMKVTITGTYDLPDDLSARQEAYGTTDPAECADVDENQEMFALIEWCEDADVKVEPVYPEFSAGEVRVEVVRDTGLVSMSVPGGENAVKVTHQPTGKFAVAVGKGPLADLQRNALIDLRKQVYP